LARLLLPHVSRQEWDTVAQLAIQIANKNSLSGAARALKFMLDSESDRPGWWNITLFTTRCAEFLHMGPQLMRYVSRNALNAGLKELMRPAGRRGISAPFSNVLRSLGNVLPELRSSVADELSKEFLSRLTSRSESERRTSRELLYIFPILILEGDRTEARSFWREWHASLFSNTVLRDSYPDARDWRAALATGVLPLVTYLTKSPLESKMPLDRLLVQLDADFVDVSYPAPIETLITMSWKWSSSAGYDDSVVTTSARGNRSIPEYLSIAEDLRQLGAYSASLGQPPWVSRDALAGGKFSYVPLPEELNDEIDPDALWGLVLLALLTFEAIGLSRNSDLKRMGFLESVAAATARGSSFDAARLGQYVLLDKAHIELLTKWMRGEVNFISLPRPSK
jgi:hypothetical protein